MDRKELIGSGGKIGRLVMPFAIVGLLLNVLLPDVFSIGGPSNLTILISILFLIPGLIIWFWSGRLIINKVPKNELITTGPFALMKHPLYTSVALLVLPGLGFLFNTWLGLLLGIMIYVGSRRYSPEEEKVLSESFGPRWTEYCNGVKMPWL